MNINLQRILKSGFCLILLGLLPMLVSAQVGLKATKTGFVDSLLIFQLTSANFDPFIITEPSQGKVLSLEKVTSDQWEVVYEPNPDFIGFDNLVIEHNSDHEPGTRVGIVNTEFLLKIVPSLVEAMHDYGIVEEGETLSLEVIKNDSVSHGDLVLESVFPVVNHGKVSMGDQPGFVDFKPETGFTGLADFNYIACDDLGTCATGSASVYVNPKGKIYNDEIRLGTGQNTKKAIPMPFMVTGTDRPNNVKIEVSGYAVVYEPDFDATETQEFTVYGEGGHQRTITMDVIERPANAQSLAKDDIAYALLGESVQVNVLENDNMDEISRVDYFPFAGTRGTIEKTSEGVITFTPRRGFSGTAKIAYRAFDAQFNEHWATTHIVYNRHNFGPNDRDYAYKFKVSPGKSRSIDFVAPVDNYQLRVDENSNPYGKLQEQAKGSILYQAPEEGGLDDEFEVLYCAPANTHPDDCQRVKVTMEITEEEIVAGCSDSCVTPGDLNADGIVNSLDLLPLGLQIGAKGFKRNNASTEFTPQIAADWDMSLVEGTTNLKYHDANGDGVLTERDVQPILDNYGQVNRLIPYSPLALSKRIDLNIVRVKPTLEEIPQGEPIPAGTEIELAITIGEEEAQELDLYGFTFPFKMNGKSQIDPASFKVAFHNDSWAALNSPTLSLQKEVSTNNADQISLDLGFTRTSRTAVSGMGQLATVGFIVIVDDLEFRLPKATLDFNIEIGTPYSIDQDGQYYEYEGTSITLPVSIGQTTSVETLPPSTIDVFPNPAREQITLQLHNTTNTINDIVLYNLAGAAVYEAKDLHAATYEVPVADLAEGLYIAHLVTDDGVLSKKFEIVR